MRPGRRGRRRNRRERVPTCSRCCFWWTLRRLRVAESVFCCSTWGIRLFARRKRVLRTRARTADKRTQRLAWVPSSGRRRAKLYRHYLKSSCGDHANQERSPILPAAQAFSWRTSADAGWFLSDTKAHLTQAGGTLRRGCSGSESAVPLPLAGGSV